MKKLLVFSLCSLFGIVMGLVMACTAWFVVGLFTNSIVIRYVAVVCTYPITFFAGWAWTRFLVQKLWY